MLTLNLIDLNFKKLKHLFIKLMLIGVINREIRDAVSASFTNATTLDSMWVHVALRCTTWDWNVQNSLQDV